MRPNLLRQIRHWLTVIMVLGHFTSPQSVQAVGVNGSWWTFDMSFNNGLTAELIVDMGEDVNGSVPYPVITKVFPIDCIEVGAVPIVGGIAHFNGAGHIECRVDIQSALEETYKECIRESEKCLAPPNGVERYGRIVSRGSVAPAVAGQVDYPLIHADDLYFGLEFLSPTLLTNPINFGVTKSTGAFDMASASIVPGSSWGGPMQSYGATYMCDDTLLCNTSFGAGPGTAQTPLVADSPIEFTLTMQTFTIGANPTAGTHFVGEMDHIFIDPGAFGSGGG